MKIIDTDLAVGIGALPSFPVVLVTVDQNILTAGAFHFYSFNPPAVMVGIVPDKYTFKLITKFLEFGINIPRFDQREVVKICGSISGNDVANKYARAGVTPFKGNVITSSLVEECPLNLECRVVHKVDFPGSHQWFIGEIVAVHRDEDYARDQALMFWGGDYRKVGKFLERAW